MITIHKDTIELIKLVKSIKMKIKERVGDGIICDNYVSNVNNQNVHIIDDFVITKDSIEVYQFDGVEPITIYYESYEQSINTYTKASEQLNNPNVKYIQL